MSVGLAEAGADVVASSRRQEQVDEAAVQIESKGKRALRLTSDVSKLLKTSPEEAERLKTHYATATAGRSPAGSACESDPPNVPRWRT